MYLIFFTVICIPIITSEVKASFPIVIGHWGHFLFCEFPRLSPLPVFWGCGFVSFLLIFEVLYKSEHEPFAGDVGDIYLLPDYNLPFNIAFAVFYLFVCLFGCRNV